jgi:CRP/FNR family transcriptional regulator
MAAAAEFLKGIPYLADLEPPDIERVARTLVERHFARGESVFLEGDPCEGLYLVVSGRVRIYKVSEEGREQVLTLAGPGETFNEVPVFDGGPNAATVQALEATTLYVLPAKDFLRLAAEYPSIWRGMMKVFASRLRQLTVLVEDLSFRQVRSRVAKVLLQWQEEGQRGSTPPRLTQREIAAMVGSAREVVGRALHALDEAGAMRLERGHIAQIDGQKLIEFL